MGGKVGQKQAGLFPFPPLCSPCPPLPSSPSPRSHASFLSLYFLLTLSHHVPLLSFPPLFLCYLLSALFLRILHPFAAPFLLFVLTYLSYLLPSRLHVLFLSLSFASPSLVVPRCTPCLSPHPVRYLLSALFCPLGGTKRGRGRGRVEGQQLQPYSPNNVSPRAKHD